MGRIEKENTELDVAVFDNRLRSHLIDPELLRANDFTAFMSARQNALVDMIATAIGKPVIFTDEAEDGEQIDEDPTEIDLLGSEAI